jgi:hypothetical protein
LKHPYLLEETLNNSVFPGVERLNGSGGSLTGSINGSNNVVNTNTVSPTSQHLIPQVQNAASSSSSSSTNNNITTPTPTASSSST